MASLLPWARTMGCRPYVRRQLLPSSTGNNVGLPTAGLFSTRSGFIRRPGQGSMKQDETKLRLQFVSLDFGDYDQEDANKSFEKYTALRSSAESSSPAASWDDEEMELAQKVKAIQIEEDNKKKRWLENAKPPVRVPIIDPRGRAYGRGSRKTASARVWIQPGFGNVVVNRKDFVDYFDRMGDREHLLAPLAATGTCGLFDVSAYVEGGGLRGQAGAIRHGLARALNAYDPDLYRPALKRLGYLTRDSRMVERKKIGRVKARKRPQWVKR